MAKFHLPNNELDTLVEEAVFGSDDIREKAQHRIRELATICGIFPASIQGLYEAAGKGLYHGITVPAINIRGITYHVARAVFRAALKGRVGAFIFEIARSEIGYTNQRPSEFAACVLAAAIGEQFEGPIFIQGDHFQINAKKYESEQVKELNAIKELICESIDAGFFNIDIDASTVVDLTEVNLTKQQEKNSLLTADLTTFIRSHEPRDVVISVGAEIGEVGKKNSTVQDLTTFMSVYLNNLGPNLTSISKISVQTGTTHGGIVLPDGSIAKIQLDFETLKKLSKAAREKYGLAGAVQHGASTLPDEAFDLFPQVGAAEVHLATGFQNLIFDSPDFPKMLLQEIYRHLLNKYRSNRESRDTNEQFLYKNRKRAFGDFKHELWCIPKENLERIGNALEARFSLIFEKLNVTNTIKIIKRYVSSS